MHTELEAVFASEISQSERRMLSEILKSYDLHVRAVEKVRSAYKLLTDEGDFCLKRVSHGYRKAKKSFFIMEYLREKGFDNLAEYYFSRKGKPLIKYRDAAFYITYWIDGREVSFKKKKEILRCTELLAQFHNAVKGFEAPRHVEIRNHVKKWGKEFGKCRKQLEDFRKTIDKMKLKADFDYTYRDNIDYFLKEADFAAEILNGSRYAELCEYWKNERYICHDSFYYQNIIIDRNNKMHIVDMESCRYDIPAGDLGKLIRRVLSKGRYKWDFDLCRRMIESYCRIRPMSREEYEILLALLVFPQKFWKLGKKRYIKNKKWNEEKYRKKLHKLLNEGRYKREFIYCYTSFYSLDTGYMPEIVELQPDDRAAEICR